MRAPELLPRAAPPHRVGCSALVPRAGAMPRALRVHASPLTAVSFLWFPLSMAAAAVAKPAATPWGAQENEVGEANEPVQEEEDEEEDEIAALNEMINEQNAQWQQKYERDPLVLFHPVHADCRVSPCCA